MMNEPRTAHLRHPLAEAYIADLERALTGSDEREHTETVASIREHLDDVLTQGMTEQDVRAVLAELGSVDTISAAATWPTPTGHPGPTNADPLAITTLVAAAAAAGLLVPLPFVAVPLAVLALVMGILHLRAKRPGRRLALVGLIVAASTIVVAIVLALTLVSSTGGDEPQPDPVQSSQ